jgi:uncharacterized membrane protein (DUF373 family)
VLWIAIVVELAVWNLMLKILSSILSSGIDPNDYTVFQNPFGLIFTVKRSLFVIAERERGIVQARTVVLIALVAIVRKLMIFDLTAIDAQHLFALAAAILALGGVYWLVCDRDGVRRLRARPGITESIER